MSEKFQQILQTANSALAHIQVRSALNPLIWFLGLFGVGCVVVLCLSEKEFVQVTMLFFIGAMILVGVGSFLYLLLKNPDYLRSESYQIQKHSLEMLGTKTEQLATSADHVVAIAAPGRSGDEP